MSLLDICPNDLMVALHSFCPILMMVQVYARIPDPSVSGGGGGGGGGGTTPIGITQCLHFWRYKANTKKDIYLLHGITGYRVFTW